MAKSNHKSAAKGVTSPHFAASANNSVCQVRARQPTHYGSISLLDWPVRERLGSLLLSTLICLFACVASLFTPETFGQLVLAVIAIGSASAVREDVADTWDALKQLVYKTQPEHSNL